MASVESGIFYEAIIPIGSSSTWTAVVKFLTLRYVQSNPPPPSSGSGGCQLIAYVESIVDTFFYFTIQNKNDFFINISLL